MKQVNDGLERYYRHKGVNYKDEDGEGKFEKWCEENGYDTDMIQEELDAGYDECIFIEFDEEFPLTQPDNEENKKRMQIIKIIEYCWDNDAAFVEAEDAKFILDPKNDFYKFPQQELWDKRHLQKTLE